MTDFTNIDVARLLGYTAVYWIGKSKRTSGWVVLAPGESQPRFDNRSATEADAWALLPDWKNHPGGGGKTAQECADRFTRWQVANAEKWRRFAEMEAREAEGVKVA